MRKLILTFLAFVISSSLWASTLMPAYFSPSCYGIPFSDVNFTATDVCAAIIEAKQNAEGFPRAGIRGSYNGSVSGGSWLGPNELLPNTPLAVFPVKTKINEITWSNATTNVQFHIEFRSVSKTGTIFYTLTVTSTNPGYGYVSGLNYTFDPGSVIYAQYQDDGTNTSDMDLILWISRVP